MFTAEERDRVRGRVLELAAADPRVVAGAAVGSLANGGGDHFCIERGKVWQAEHWIGELRDHALALACRRLALPVRYARDFDDLPGEVLSPLDEARPRSLERAELLRALAVGVDGLPREAGEARELAARIEPQLRELVSADLS